MTQSTEPMSEDDLRAFLDGRMRRAVGFGRGGIADERAKANDYYHGEMAKYLPAEEGESSAVSRDVLDAVEGVMPDLMEVFAGADQVCEFDPVGPEDEEAAAQETEYVNHVFYKKNRGFEVLYSFIKDALMLKTGVVKHWWEISEDQITERYTGLADEVYALLLHEVTSDETMKVVAHSSRTVTEGGVTVEVHDLVIRRTIKRGRVRVMPVPPEDFLRDPGARSLADAKYAGHRTRKTESDLLAQGYDPERVHKLPSWAGGDSSEARSRRPADTAGAPDDSHRPMREIEIVEHIVQVDYDGDGLAEWRLVVTDSDCSVILSNEEAGGDAADMFSINRALLQPHEFEGVSLAELVMDVQAIKTALLRQLLNNIYRVNAPRLEVLESACGPDTLDDLANTETGAIIRVKQANGIRPLVVPSMIADVIAAMEVVDAVKENRSGVTRMNQGMDADTLNHTATGIAKLLQAGDRRVKLIARVMAETGIKDMMLALHRLCLRHQDWAETVRLRGSWVPVDPREWRTRTDMTVTVGLGTGDKTRDLIILEKIMGLQAKAIEFQGGLTGPMVTLTHVWQAAKKLIEAGGMKNPEAFFTEPRPEDKLPPRPNPKAEEAKARMQLEQAKLQADIARQQAELQLEREKAEAETQLAREKMGAEFALERERMAAAMMMGRGVGGGNLGAIRPGGEVG